MIESAIRLILVGDETVNAITGERITFGIADQNERRARIMLSIVDKTNWHTLTGKAGYTTGRLEAACLAPSYQEAKELAIAVTEALDCFEGMVDEVTDISISYLTVDTENDIPVVVPEGAALPSTYGVMLNFNFMYVPVPAVQLPPVPVA